MHIRGGYIAINICAMLVVLIVIVVCLHLAARIYTNHGEVVRVPDVSGMSLERAKLKLEKIGLVVNIADSAYNHRLPSGQVLKQLPAKDSRVKPGREIYLTINSKTASTIQIPDLIENSSYRKAEATLTAMGFKLSKPQLVHGEKDFVYGIIYNRKNVYTGDFVPVTSRLMLQIGDGTLDEMMSNVEQVDIGEEEQEVLDEEFSFDDIE
ncbi:MAG: PASTA domain-containing protein [Prevotella sp.]|nr:PASTA domain-containing protein [Candidatus Equicola faecalis]